MSHRSPFTITQHDVAQHVKNNKNREDNRQCYLLHVGFQTVYSDHELPAACFKKLPRLINGIPLGAGKISGHQTQHIQWRYVEGSQQMHAFVSAPMTWTEAEDARCSFKECLVRQAKAVFGDLTVKATIILSKCLHYDDEFFINDIANSMQEGLHFTD